MDVCLNCNGDWMLWVNIYAMREFSMMMWIVEPKVIRVALLCFSAPIWHVSSQIRNVRIIYWRIATSTYALRHQKSSFIHIARIPGLNGYFVPPFDVTHLLSPHVQWVYSSILFLLLFCEYSCMEFYFTFWVLLRFTSFNLFSFSLSFPFMHLILHQSSIQVPDWGTYSCLQSRVSEKYSCPQKIILQKMNISMGIKKISIHTNNCLNLV